MKGICTHSPSNDDLRMIADRGYDCIREDIRQDTTNPKEGEYRIQDAQRLADECAKLNLSILWVAGFGSRQHETYGKWLRVLGSNLPGDFEPWNEPNRDNFTPEDYVSLVKVARQALPNRIIHAGALSNVKGTSSIDWAYIEQMIVHGVLDFADFISIHPYIQVAPARRSRDMEKLRFMISGPNDADNRISWTEFGYSTAWKGVDPLNRLAYLAEARVICDALGIPMWDYCWNVSPGVTGVEAGFVLK